MSKKLPVILTDESPMPFGKHKGKPMEEVPARYLLWLYDENKCTPEVRWYIHENLDVLNSELKNSR